MKLTEKLNSLIGGESQVAKPTRGARAAFMAEKAKKDKAAVNSRLDVKGAISGALMNDTSRMSMMPKTKPAIKQYGDKGYVPSNGKGVGI